MNDTYKTITVVSSAGSGNVFCQHLLRNNLKVNIRWVYHDIDQADKDGINLVFVRNPYDNVASGLEVMFEEVSEEQKKEFISNPGRIINRVQSTLQSNQKYIDHAKKFDHITPVTFEFLTKTPDKFLKYISEKFDIEYLDENLSGQSVEQYISKMGVSANRMPREKSDFRKTIDYYVYRSPSVAKAYDEYIEYRDVLQLTENML
jgi:hypothetical protein